VRETRGGLENEMRTRHLYFFFSLLSSRRALYTQLHVSAHFFYPLSEHDRRSSPRNQLRNDIFTIIIHILLLKKHTQDDLLEKGAAPGEGRLGVGLTLSPYRIYKKIYIVNKKCILYGLLYDTHKYVNRVIEVRRCIRCTCYLYYEEPIRL
jgi:hypothetical protein